MFPLESTTYNKCQFLILNSDLSGQLHAGYIGKIYIAPSNYNPGPTASFTNFTVKMKTTNLTNFGTVRNRSFITGLTTVLGPTTMSFNNLQTDHWVEIDLSTPFFYDGTSNLIVEFSQTSYVSGINIRMRNNTFNGRIFGGVGSSTASATDGDLQFGFDYGNIHANNAGIDSLMNPNSNGQFCSGDQEVKVNLVNAGSADLDSVDVDWTVNGTPQNTVSLSFNPPLPSSSDTVITLGTIDFPYQTGIDISAWSSQPNGVTDSVPSNDTIHVLGISASKQTPTDTIIPGDTSVCIGSEITLDAQNSGDTYDWNTGATTPTITVTIDSTTTFSVEVTSPQGCTATHEVRIGGIPQPVAGTIDAQSGQNGIVFSTTGTTPGVNYYWDFGDSTRSFDESPTHAYTTAGSYIVTLVVSNGCGSDTTTLKVTGINEINLGRNQLILYPNPANHKVIIDNRSHYKMQSIIVYNILGQVVHRTKTNNSSHYQLDVTHYAAGVYQAKIVLDKGQWVMRKFEVRH